MGAWFLFGWDHASPEPGSGATAVIPAAFDGTAGAMPRHREGDRIRASRVPDGPGVGFRGDFRSIAGEGGRPGPDILVGTIAMKYELFAGKRLATDRPGSLPVA